MKETIKPFCWGILSSFFLISCSGDRVFEEFKAIENESWNEKDSISFDLNFPLEEAGKTLIGIRFNESYPFTNLYVRFLGMDSLGYLKENKLLNVPLFDSKSGSPLGKGFGDTFTKFDTLPFTIGEDIKSISVVQYMRKEEIEGVDAIGIKILKK